MLKFFKKIHLWLSIPFGIFITLICLSGASLVFEEEITEAVNKDLYNVTPSGQPALSADEISEKVIAQLPDSAKIINVIESDQPDKAYQVIASVPARASLVVDQYTGQVKGQEERLAFFKTMFTLHRWLLCKDQNIPRGKMVVGYTTIALVFILITGLLIWLFNRKKPLTKSLKITTNKGLPRFYHDLHVAGGIYVTLFILAMALTGLTWSFPWYREGFYSLFDSNPAELHKLIYSIHTGSWGGITTKIIYFIAALIGATLPLTGYYLWIKKRHRNDQQKP